MKKALVASLVLALVAVAYWSNGWRTEPTAGSDRIAPALAAGLANRETAQRFGVEPFTAESGSVSIEGKQWNWSAAKGYGHSDLRASVSVVQGKPVVQIDQIVIETWE